KVLLFQRAGQVNPLQATWDAEKDAEERAAAERRNACCCLFRYWPFSAVGRALGVAGSNQVRCIKCPKFVNPFLEADAEGGGIKCPNTAACQAVYCVQCYASLHRVCSACRAEIRDAAEQLSSSD